MKTYTMHAIGQLTAYVSDDTHRVHHAVSWQSSNPVALYPYTPGQGGHGWDNVCDVLTLPAVRSRISRGTIAFF